MTERKIVTMSRMRYLPEYYEDTIEDFWRQESRTPAPEEFIMNCYEDDIFSNEELKVWFENPENPSNEEMGEFINDLVNYFHLYKVLAEKEEAKRLRNEANSRDAILKKELNKIYRELEYEYISDAYRNCLEDKKDYILEQLKVSKNIKDSLGEDFFGAKEGTEEADDILFALQVQYGDPKLTYDECRKEFTKEEVKRAVACVKRYKLNKFTYFNDSLNKRQRNILAKHILDCYSDRELLDIIYELIDWDNKLFDKAMDIYEGEGSVQYRAKKISDLLIKDNISLKDNFSKVGLLRIKVKTENLLDALKRGDISIGYINGNMDRIEERFAKLIGRRVDFDIKKPYSVLNWGQAFLYLNGKPKRYSDIEYQVYEDELEEKESTYALKTLKQKVINELSQVFIPVNQITFESEARILKR